MALQPAFVWGAGGKRMTPEEIERERRIVQALTGGVDTSPVGHWSQGAARVVDALGGVMRERRADRAETQNADFNQDLIGRITASLGGGSSMPGATMSDASPASFASSQPSMPAGPVETPEGATINGRVSQAHSGTANPVWRDAIASIESAGSGDYSAVGPTHPKLGRALGRYQVMEANIGPWSEKHLGRTVTPDEFMANPALQDAIFDAEFGSYVDRFGSPDRAAQAWFGGPGGVGKLDRQDSLGTSIGEYSEKFNAAMGAEPAAGVVNAMAQNQPVQVAQSGGISPAIMEAMTSPYADENTRRIASVLLEQQMAQQAQASDPMRALEIERAQLENEALRNPDPADIINAGDGRLYDPNSGQWITAPGANEPSSRPMSAEERAQWGIPNDGSPWAMTPDGPEQLVDGPLVQNNIGNGDKFIEESDKAAAGRINEIVAQGNAASQFLGDVQQLGALGAQIQTGRGAQVMAQLGPWAETVGVDIEALGPAEAYNAIVARLAPQMRPAGSGATSDFDARQFLQALPSLGNTPEGNAIIIGTFEAIQQNKLQAAEIGSLALIPESQGGITWQEAEKRIRELPNPYERFKETFGRNDAPAQRGGRQPVVIDGFTIEEVE